VVEAWISAAGGISTALSGMSKDDSARQVAVSSPWQMAADAVSFVVANLHAYSFPLLRRASSCVC
jgi:hypothetical protein